MHRFGLEAEATDQLTVTQRADVSEPDDLVGPPGNPPEKPEV